MKYLFLILLFFNNLFTQPHKIFFKENLEYKDIDSLKISYKSNQSNEIFLKKISEEHNDMVTYYDIGETSYLRNKIPAIMITVQNNNENKLSILFNCTHHANELISTEHCYDIIYQILKNKTNYSNYLNYLKIWVVPMINTDGSYLFWNKSIMMGRKNGNNVDLNRNYPFIWNSGHPTASSGDEYHSMYRGSSMASESETKAMMNLAERERFVFSISFHSNGAKILYPYTVENVKNPSDEYPRYFAKHLAKLTKQYHAVKNLYPVDGTDQDYYYFKYDTMAFLLESSLQNPQYQKVENAMREMEMIWQEIIEQTVNGEKILLKIVDENNKNLEAEVRVDDFKYYNNEKFTSNPINGIYCKMVKERKNYQIIINHSNYETLKTEIVSNNIMIKKIVLKKKQN
jgi:hypothetical protein